MSAAARVARRAVQLLRPRGTRGMGGAKEPFWSEGKQTGPNGYLFNETPPPPGESRVPESWEAIWIGSMAGAAVILGVGLNSKPNTSLKAWAHEEAKADLLAKAK